MSTKLDLKVGHYYLREDGYVTFMKNQKTVDFYKDGTRSPLVKEVLLVDAPVPIIKELWVVFGLTTKNHTAWVSACFDSEQEAIQERDRISAVTVSLRYVVQKVEVSFDAVS